MTRDKVGNKGTALFLGCTLIIGCILRCWNINQSFWWDEIWSTMTYVNASSLWHVVSSLGYYFNNHILYSLLARGFITLLGESEFAARLPALILGLVALIAVFQFGKTFLGTPAGMIASLLLAVSAFHIDHTSEARGYSGLALFAVLSSFYFLKGMKTNEYKSWILYGLCTVLGFYSHVFMIAVSLSQFCSALLLLLGEKWGVCENHSSPGAFKSFLLSFSLTGISTLLIYSPVLTTFFNNLNKVRLVSVNRIPFIMSLLNTLVPGVHSFFGSIVYSVLFLCGMYYVFRTDRTLFLFMLVLFILPLSLYLLINPMFVFERYFIFVLPFIVLVFGRGIAGLAEHFSMGYKSGSIVLFLAIIMYLQFPAIHKILSQDRQNYREALAYVVHEIKDRKGDLVFSIGYAGEHFQYYASDRVIATPKTFDEFYSLMQDKERIWCLITAWLPDIRPPYEDKTLYSEDPGQAEIYDYIQKHFTRIKVFQSKYPVEIYFLGK